MLIQLKFSGSKTINWLQMVNCNSYWYINLTADILNVLTSQIKIILRFFFLFYMEEYFIKSPQPNAVNELEKLFN